MPGWILVANRSSLLPIFQRTGGLLSVIASLTCLVVVSGCSNIRQKSLEMPLPILPSEVAKASQTGDGKIDSPSLTANDSVGEVSEDDSVAENALVLEEGSSRNQFVASEVDSQSVQSFLPSDNDFQLQQPRARFVGALENAKMTEINKTTTTDAAPAPKIAQASHVGEVDDCEASDACESDAQCDCCKKKSLPKLAIVEPIDPEQMPELFGSTKTTNEYKIAAPNQTTLRPLPAMNVAAAPITLTAKQNWDTSGLQDATKIDNSAQTQNKAQMLIPIAPAALQAFKAEVDQIKTQEAQLTAAEQTIKVSPNMDIESIPAKSSTLMPAVVAGQNKVAVAPEVTKPTKIRVSEVPFQPLPLSPPKPVFTPVEPVAKPESSFVGPLTPMAGPLPVLSPIEVAKAIKTVEPVVVAEPVEVVEPIEVVEDSSEPLKAVERFCSI